MPASNSPFNGVKNAAKLGRLAVDLARTNTSRFLTFAAPGHFYSPLPDMDEILREQERLFADPEVIPGIDLRETAQLETAERFAQLAREMQFPESPTPDSRYYLDNSYFSYGDATALYCMLRENQPKRVIEIGSGFSSALMLETRARHFKKPFELVCVEPFPERLNSLLRSEDHETCEIIQAPVQSVPTHRFAELEANDILFVDSSHVAKAGSDVLDIFYRVLPALQRGVLIHIHDIPWPFEYPLQWFEEGRAWNEAYLLRSFLQFNESFRIEFFNDYLAKRHADVIRQHLPAMLGRASAEVNLSTSSIWLRRVS